VFGPDRSFFHPRFIVSVHHDQLKSTTETGHSPVKERAQRKPELNKINRNVEVFHLITWKYFTLFSTFRNSQEIKGLRTEGFRS